MKKQTTKTIETALPVKSKKRRWAENIALAIGILLAIYLVMTITGCAPLQWAITQDPITGAIPALAALPSAASEGFDGFDGLLGTGLLGALAFLGTYGKTLRRLWLNRGSKK